MALDSDYPGAGVADLQLESLSRSYDAPAELAFSTVGGSRWPADTRVRLLLDTQPVFVGLLDLPTMTHSARDAGRTAYRAFDRSRLLAGRTSEGADGQTSGETQYGDLSVVADAYLAAVSGVVAGAGVATTGGYVGGAAGVPCYPISIEAESVESVLRRIASAAPGVRVHMRAAEPKYSFVRLRGTEIVNIAIENCSDVSITETLEGCCGAVQTRARSTSVSGEVTVALLLAPAWEQGQQAAWTLSQAASSIVFRMWSYGASSIGAAALPNPTAAMWLEVQRVSGGAWERVSQISSGQINYVAKTLWSQEPLLGGFVERVAARRNPNIPGYAVPPPGVRLVFTLSGSGTVPIPVARYPANGYSGRAYSIAPESMGFSRTIDVPSLPSGASFDPARWTRAMHDAVSEPATRGTLTVMGDPTAALCGLERRISLVGGRRTGYESLAAPLMSIEVDFAARQYTLGFDSREPVLMGATT